MPWHLDDDHPDCSGWAVVQDSNGKVVGCHPTKPKALAHLAALNANVKETDMKAKTVAEDDTRPVRPPRDNLVRALAPGVISLRAVDGSEDDQRVMYGHFGVFDQWTEIDSFFEGHFMERFVAGAFRKTLRENPPKPLFQHGMDPELGDRVLGVPDVLREDGVGAYYEVPLFRSVPELVVEGLEAGAYGASFRFRVLREEFNREPGKARHNPEGLPERTVKEVDVMEFGPVTFPAYAGASAGLRSLTDEVVFSRYTQDPGKLRAIIDYVRSLDGDDGDDEPDEPDETTEERTEETAEPAPSPPTPDDESTSDERRDVPLFGQEKGGPEWLL